MLREEAIKKHRAMWNWIAQQIVKKQRTMNIAILKAKFSEFQGDDTLDMKNSSNCYLCYYTRFDCKKCPLLWPSESNILKCEYGYKLINSYSDGLCYSDGLYRQSYKLWVENDWQLQATLCRAIANLPEREMSK